jgi:diguanylate cyclase (GGDEF)-like protein
MADLDRFKNINDTHGHQGGDAVLREAAHRMKSAIRRYDSVGRYGGEEFLFVLPGCQGADALVQAKRIREALAAEPFAAGNRSFPVTCSVGVSYRVLPDQEQADVLVREADMALYSAKKAGRNQVAICETAPLVWAGAPGHAVCQTPVAGNS